MAMKVGSWVQLKKRTRSGPQKAQIVSEDPAFAEGAVLLSTRIGGFRWWNKEDLILTSPPPMRKGRRNI
jgi:hypothetical protein